MTNIQDETIHVLYKKMGETPWECIKRFKTENHEFEKISMTYAGRLDPMAEGLLLVISGEAIAEKEKYLGLPKTYEFEILWECSSDTGDILGVVSSDEISIFPTVEDVKKYINNNIGKFDQIYPAYSSQPVEGPTPEGGRVSKSLIEWSREGRINEVTIPSHEVEIFDAEYITRRFESGKDLLLTINSRILLVHGDFRQEKILKEWHKILGSNMEKQYAIDKIKMNVSGGFYVRQFVMDMAQALNTKGLTFHILRTEVAEYKI